MSFLMVLSPATTAVILVYRKNQVEGVVRLLQRAVDFGRIEVKVWYLPIFLLMPGIGALSYALMRLMGAPIPAPQISVIAVLALFIAFFIAALCEELGWTGYATEPMQKRWGTLRAGVLLGLVGRLAHRALPAGSSIVGVDSLV